jgi:DNA (cytosine-5)-methyltransferase 1
VVRHLHTEEIDRTGSKSPLVGPGLSREHSLIIEDDEEEDAVIVTEGFRSRGKCRARSPSVEVLELPKRRSSLPVKSDRYTFADVFCGAGGASQGALQAGLHVCWGLDNDEEALNAYYLNHPGTLPFCRNAHHFPPLGFKNSDLRVDVLHLSPPCCYWSPAQ